MSDGDDMRALEGESPYKSVGGPGRIWNALRYSIRGLAHAVRVESAFRQELIGAAVVCRWRWHCACRRWKPWP